MTASHTRMKVLRLTLDLSGKRRSRLLRLRTMLGSETVAEAARIALGVGVGQLIAELPSEGPAPAKVTWGFPAALWTRIHCLSKVNGRSTNAEIIAALEHWIETAETKRGEVPA